MEIEYQNPKITIELEEFRNQIKNSSLDIFYSTLDDFFKLLDGSNTIEMIIGTLIVKGYELEDINKMLKWLSDKNLIQESKSSDFGKFSQLEKEYFNNQINFLGSFRPSDNGLLSISKSGISFQVALKESVVFIVGNGIASDELINNFIKIGIGHIYLLDTFKNITSRQSTSFYFYKEIDLDKLVKDKKPNLLIYCDDNFDLEKCLKYNRISINRNIPFLPYRRTYLNIEIGPLVLPKKTACYYCSDSRKKSASMYVDEFEKSTISLSLDRKLNFPIGIEYLTLEVLKILSEIYTPSLKNKLFSFDLITGKTSLYPVFRLPRCRECGVNRLKPNKKLWEEI